MSMGEVEAPRSSESLRGEAAVLVARQAELHGKISQYDEKLRLLSLAILRDDKTAGGRAVSLRKAKDEAAEQVQLIIDARAVLDGEIRDALAREERERLDAAADEQDRAAAAIEGLGAKVDETILAFKKALSAFRAAARHAGAYHEGAVEKGGGNEAQLRALMRNALAWELRDVPELEVSPPMGLARRLSFDAIGRARADSARGTALRLRAPPPAPRKPNGESEVALILSEAIGDRKVPTQVDLLAPLPGDDPSFRAYTPGESS